MSLLPGACFFVQERTGEKWRKDVKTVPEACCVGQDGKTFNRNPMLDGARRNQTKNHAAS